MMTLASLLVMVLTITAGALWLARPMRADDESPRRFAGLGSGGLAHVPSEEDLVASMRRHPSALPAAVRPPVHPTPHLHTPARIVFATLRDGNLLLDCVVAENPTDSSNPDALAASIDHANLRHLEVGLPITLSLGEVGTPWLAVHIEAMLERWAEGERIIDLELRDSPLGPRATLISASSRVVLPLATVAGLS